MKVSEQILWCGYIIAGYWGVILGLLTEIPVAAWALLALMILDVASGVGAAYVNYTISSKASRRGMVKKTMVLMLVMAASILAHVLPGSWNFPAGSVVASMFCLHEFISILENTRRAGIEHPKFLKELVDRLAREGIVREPVEPIQVPVNREIRGLGGRKGKGGGAGGA